MPSYCYRLSIHRTRKFGRRLRPFRRNKFGFRKRCLSLSLHFRLKTACMRVCDHMSMPPLGTRNRSCPCTEPFPCYTRKAHLKLIPSAYTTSNCWKDQSPFLSREDQSPKPRKPCSELSGPRGFAVDCLPRKIWALFKIPNMVQHPSKKDPKRDPDLENHP